MNAVRIYHKMQKIRMTDKSFTEKPSMLETLFGTDRISRAEVREIWLQGIETGIFHGLQMASLEGQRIELDNRPKTRLQDEFVRKFFALCEQYGCGIQIDPKDGGLCVVDRNYSRAVMAGHYSEPKEISITDRPRLVI